MDSSSLIPLSSITGSVCRGTRLLTASDRGIRIEGGRRGMRMPGRRMGYCNLVVERSVSTSPIIPYSSTTTVRTDISNAPLDARLVDPEHPSILCLTFFPRRLASRPWFCSGFGLTVPGPSTISFVCLSPLSIIRPVNFSLTESLP